METLTRFELLAMLAVFALQSLLQNGICLVQVNYRCQCCEDIHFDNVYMYVAHRWITFLKASRIGQWLFDSLGINLVAGRRFDANSERSYRP